MKYLHAKAKLGWYFLLDLLVDGKLRFLFIEATFFGVTTKSGFAFYPSPSKDHPIIQSPFKISIWMFHSFQCFNHKENSPGHGTSLLFSRVRRVPGSDLHKSPQGAFGRRHRDISWGNSWPNAMQHNRSRVIPSYTPTFNEVCTENEHLSWGWSPRSKDSELRNPHRVASQALGASL